MNPDKRLTAVAFVLAIAWVSVLAAAFLRVVLA